jgi:hypothetical protein
MRMCVVGWGCCEQDKPVPSAAVSTDLALAIKYSTPLTAAELGRAQLTSQLTSQLTDAS